jgi:hypothetical protein
VCGEATKIRPIAVGPFKVDLCTTHAMTANVAAILMQKFLG